MILHTRLMHLENAPGSVNCSVFLTDLKNCVNSNNTLLLLHLVLERKTHVPCHSVNLHWIPESVCVLYFAYTSPLRISLSSILSHQSNADPCLTLKTFEKYFSRIKHINHPRITLINRDFRIVELTSIKGTTVLYIYSCLFPCRMRKRSSTPCQLFIAHLLWWQDETATCYGKSILILIHLSLSPFFYRLKNVLLYKL